MEKISGKKMDFISILYRFRSVFFIKPFISVGSILPLCSTLLLIYQCLDVSYFHYFPCSFYYYSYYVPKLASESSELSVFEILGYGLSDYTFKFSELFTFFHGYFYVRQLLIIQRFLGVANLILFSLFGCIFFPYFHPSLISASLCGIFSRYWCISF